MFHRAHVGAIAGLMMALAGVSPVDAQVSARVAVREGPIAVDLVFGPQYRAAHRSRVVYREAPAPVRYRRGMSLWELERYLERIEIEYDYFRRMSPRDAYYEYGWSRHELRDYVRFLRDERRFLRDERDRLYRADRDRRDHPGRGVGRGRGKGRGPR